ncbi:MULTISPECIES: 3'(2'),5'-bisphosphate nucleotidase CysQ family protein [unclassified Thermosynechococcus]|uniref:3'(2'),5'-bisphosphate nucleotidase CysQ family protein n=1 Tax=unclassified Thermosynechococcus TaxID=2622553 RepID=UPI001A0A89A0|nr:MULTISPECIES: inositol monophosphatase family protein [unclassified Thermosynechococcus]HIK35555.1 inositol monophosphatase family protein [Thermosynechococcus sp. M98_K2018_005]HIK47863.1 inositol monophosphatase family protein [Thermosynechococcus sp. M55_K2018_012]
MTTSPPLTSSQIWQINQLLRQAGQRARQLAQQPFEVIEKGRQDFATSIDRFLDRLLSQKFRAWFPEDGIISEENAASQAVFQEPKNRYWLIDPLDGTDDLIHHRQGYALMVGLLEHYSPVAGWIYAPNLDHLYYGGKDWGLFQMSSGGPPVPLLPVCPPSPSEHHCPIMIGYRDYCTYGDAIHRVLPQVEFRFLGSFGLKVIEVILGRAGLYLYLNQRVKLWDTTAPLALATAAGLVCTDLQGNPLRFDATGLQEQTLAHQQPILIGWPEYITALRSPLVEAITAVQLSLGSA